MGVDLLNRGDGPAFRQSGRCSWQPARTASHWLGRGWWWEGDLRGARYVKTVVRAACGCTQRKKPGSLLHACCLGMCPHCAPSAGQKETHAGRIRRPRPKRVEPTAWHVELARRAAGKLEFYWDTSLRPRLAGLTDGRNNLWEPVPRCCVGTRPPADGNRHTIGRAVPRWTRRR